MSSLTDLITNFGDVIELDFPAWDTVKATGILGRHPGWQIYQPHKPGHNRFGLSVTSLDGGFTGEPDLYSLREYNKMNGTTFNESHFKRRTNIVEFIPELKELLDYFEPGVGRVHFLRLDKGGFFPPHRDNGAIVNVPTFRIIVPINKCHPNEFKWVQEDHFLKLDPGTAYFINTTKIHSVFSYVDNCLLLVMNVNAEPTILDKLVKRLATI